MNLRKCKKEGQTLYLKYKMLKLFHKMWMIKTNKMKRLNNTVNTEKTNGYINKKSLYTIINVCKRLLTVKYISEKGN